MPISRELILHPRDISYIAIRCGQKHAPDPLRAAGICEGTALIVLRQGRQPDIPRECPSCRRNWDDLRQSVTVLNCLLDQLERHGASFRVAEEEGVR